MIYIGSFLFILLTNIKVIVHVFVLFEIKILQIYDRCLAKIHDFLNFSHSNLRLSNKFYL